MTVVPVDPVPVGPVSVDSAGHPGVPATDGWLPVSPCGPHCLPAADPMSALELVRVVRRLVGLVAVLLAAFVVVPLLAGSARDRTWSAVCAGLLWVTGVRVRVRGSTAGPGALVVANHLSWIDVLALRAVAPVRMLAKREVRDWPLLGALAVSTGAVFLDRTSLRDLPTTVATAADVLRSGESVCVFPEGTTWCGAAGGPFRPAVFQAALDAGVPVQPVAIVLRGPDGTPAPQASFVGEQTLVDALVSGLRLRRITCEVTVLQVTHPGPARTRAELAASAAAAIGAVTGAPHRLRIARRQVAPAVAA